MHEVANNLTPIRRIGKATLQEHWNVLVLVTRISQIKHVGFERESKPFKMRDPRLTMNKFQVVCERFFKNVVRYNKLPSHRETAAQRKYYTVAQERIPGPCE